MKRQASGDKLNDEKCLKINRRDWISMCNTHMDHHGSLAYVNSSFTNNQLLSKLSVRASVQGQSIENRILINS